MKKKPCEIGFRDAPSMMTPQKLERHDLWPAKRRITLSRILSGLIFPVPSKGLQTPVHKREGSWLAAWRGHTDGVWMKSKSLGSHRAVSGKAYYSLLTKSVTLIGRLLTGLSLNPARLAPSGIPDMSLLAWWSYEFVQASPSSVLCIGC